MNVLILGGAARLGPYVVRALEGEHTLRVTDILPLETTHEFQRVDIGSPEDVHRASEGMDAIVNCSVVREDRQAAFDVNTRGCYNMMRAAVAHGIPRVLNTGPYFTIEGDTYTSFDYEISPDVPPHPSTNLYALSKGLGQEVCKVFTENYDVHVLTFLFFNFRHHDEAEPGRDDPFAITWRDAAQAIRLGLDRRPGDTARPAARSSTFTGRPAPPALFLRKEQASPGLHSPRPAGSNVAAIAAARDCTRLGSVDIQCHFERKRRTVFADFVKDAESQAFVRDCLSFCSAKWQRKQLAKMILAYVVARLPA